MTDTSPLSSDCLQRFLFEALPIRGQIVQLTDSWQAVQARHPYPEALNRLLGELMCAGVLMTGMLKFNGTLIIQLHGKEALQLAVVECNHDLTVRATARWSEPFPENASLVELLGQGHFVLNLVPEQGQPYQGLVELKGTSLAEILKHYMAHSEQLPTSLILAAEGDRCAGMLLQRLPEAASSETTEEDWNRIQQLANTLSSKELLTLSPEAILQRLFHQETVRIFDPLHPAFSCSCSHEKVSNMLKMLGEEEVQAIVEEQGSVEIQCEFCNQRYLFEAEEAEALFQTPEDVLFSPAPTRH